ncbi:MAG: sigma-70 family RNA polymerase sigma factor [Phycisphaeraceae bacterium]|nr:sigma-70 family RNA polymerase sigma factor [Phycisphaeraceae bacterium]
MLAVCSRMGLTHAEAEDAVQMAMVSFLESYREGRYDRERGRLSAFILTILRSRAIDCCRRAHRRHEVAGSIEEIEAMSEADLGRIWLDERQGQILMHALESLREKNTDERMIVAFELYGLRGVPIEEVTTRLGMTREDVYNAKYRIARRLSPIVAKLDELYEDI